MEAELIGVSDNIQRIRDIIERVADSALNVVVCGETGVGKELVVQHLYQRSNRFGKPFVKVNCAALPDTLLESEMFGYEAGAFTGADKRRRGKFEQANGGVLFLDEIGDMSLPLQSKLLHVLQGGDFTPLGSEKIVKTDAWVIAATNHDLERDLIEGKFREDLYFRLNAIRISIKPLRRRPEDIPHLINYYIKKYSEEIQSKRLAALRKKTMERLRSYSWPGNVRELQNMIKRLMILGDDDETLDSLLRTPESHVEDGPGRSQVTSPLFDPRELANLANLSLKEMRKRAADRVEREVISYVLNKTAWNRSKATRILKISYKTLLYKIKDLGIEPPPDVFD